MLCKTSVSISVGNDGISSDQIAFLFKSFASNKVVEMNARKLFNVSLNLGPQHVVDCSSAFGNNGCNGGFFTNGIIYSNIFTNSKDQILSVFLYIFKQFLTTG